MKRKRRGRILSAFIFLCLFAGLIFVISNGTIRFLSRQGDKKALEKELAMLEYKEEVLKKDIIKMQSPDYIAKYAREKYFYSKPNEIIIKIDE